MVCPCFNDPLCREETCSNCFAVSNMSWSHIKFPNKDKNFCHDAKLNSLAGVWTLSCLSMNFQRLYMINILLNLAQICIGEFIEL